MSQKLIGIMGAMPEEITGITYLLNNKHEINLGGRIYYTGTINNFKTVIVFSRWGKVAAASTMATLILKFGITELIFTGVGGAIHPDLNIGDIVIGKRFFQHDMDARPIMKQFEIPLLGRSFFESKSEWVSEFAGIINDLLAAAHLKTVIDKADLDNFKIHHPSLHVGDIASGDKFFSSSTEKQQLRAMLPSILCVDMEGAAVAQVCDEYDVPFTIIRTISDSADEKAELDFSSFISTISSKYAAEIIRMVFKGMK